MANNFHNLVIVGGGPAALAAALYAARAGLDVQVYERAGIGGLLGNISRLENYPGFEGAGSDLAATMRRQAEAAGAHINYGECTAVRPLPDGRTDFELTIDGAAVQCGAVLVATGAEPKPLPFAVTPPVSYCAVCDGAFAKGKNVVVVGGANAAAQESLYLANLAKTVTIITHSELKADHTLAKRLQSLSNLKIIEHQEPTPDFLNQFDYVFVFIGHTPATSFLQALNTNHGLLDNNGYVITKGYATVIPGLFAAGDVCAGAVRQVVSAAGAGAAAAIAISDWLGREA